jgi:hypothetical protein
MENQYREWESKLIEEGVTATHPDNSWVKWSQFKIDPVSMRRIGSGRVGKGTLVAIGDPEAYTIVQLEEYVPWSFKTISKWNRMGDWRFTIKINKVDSEATA